LLIFYRGVDWRRCSHFHALAGLVEHADLGLALRRYEQFHTRAASGIVQSQRRRSLVRRAEVDGLRGEGPLDADQARSRSRARALVKLRRLDEAEAVLMSTETSLHVLAYNLKRVMRVLGVAQMIRAMQSARA
jgi:hypothetical protein